MWSRPEPQGRSNYEDPYVSRQGDTAKLVPRADPVVYATDASPLIDAEQSANYEARGFLEFNALFAADEIGALLDEARRLRETPAVAEPETLILEPGSNELRSIFLVHEQSPLIARLASDHRLVGLAEHLLGDRVYVHQSRLNYKPGFLGKDFYWHSDFETWHIEDGMPRMRAVSLSISLTENTHFNGPLMMITGSHLDFVRCVGETPDDHYKQSLRRQEYGVPDQGSLAELSRRGAIVASTGPAGQVTLFDCNLMHGSNSNISPYPRSNLFIVYNSVTNRLVEPFGGKAPRPEFIAARTVRPLAAQCTPLVR